MVILGREDAAAGKSVFEDQAVGDFFREGDAFPLEEGCRNQERGRSFWFGCEREKGERFELSGGCKPGDIFEKKKQRGETEKWEAVTESESCRRGAESMVRKTEEIFEREYS